MTPLEKIDSSWIRVIDNKLTFLGVLEEYYVEISKPWTKERTRSDYSLDYNNRILPHIVGHNEKTIDQYIKEDFDVTIESIARSHEEKEGSQYKDDTIQRFRRLIYAVVKMASQKGLCDNILWGTVYSIPESNSDDSQLSQQISEFVRLKKSFSTEEEKRISSSIFQDPLQRGEFMGLLLMYASGLRNAESCGANFGDIKPMRNYPGNYALWVYKTTAGATNILQASGKTGNADRVIPIPRKLYEFIMRRRSYLENLIETGQLQLSPDKYPAGVDDLPIACVGIDYTTRCSTPNLTAAARELFRKIGLNQKILAYIEKFLSNPALVLKEKEPTAYLFRRNYATILHIIGLSIAEIHYIIGHDVEDFYETRNEFVNEERLYDLLKKVSQRPLFTLDSQESAISCSDNFNLSKRNSSTLRLRVPASPGTLCAKLSTREPSDTIKVQIIGGSKKEITTIQRTSVPSYPRTINISKTFKEKF